MAANESKLFGVVTGSSLPRSRRDWSIKHITVVIHGLFVCRRRPVVSDYNPDRRGECFNDFRATSAEMGEHKEVLELCIKMV
jgi:hypothetical protein